MSDTVPVDLTSLTVQLLSAYLVNNPLSSADLPALIASTRAALATTETLAAEETPAEYAPAVSIRKSLASPDHLVSLIDGKPYKTLKRHLTTHGLTPAEYRARYKLASDYPMVAPTYAAMRRAVAAKTGLGRRPKHADTMTATENQPAKSRGKAEAAVAEAHPTAETKTVTAKTAAKPRRKAKPTETSADV